MPVHAAMTRIGDYLFIKSSGDITTIEDGVEYVQAQVAWAREEGVRKLLTDDRDMTISLDYADILALAQYWEQNELATLGLRVAALPPPSSPQGQQAYETAAANRSIVFKVFFDRRQAEDWLRKP
ncbi:MAG: hypothetical protein H0S80_08545 [Desulfovibrionaceae bacterium]|nr:hypothetical protein [Desulfovibrionaceae bacterium]